MESIFESLENLNISEECFNDIMDIVENIMTQALKNEKAAKDYFKTSNADPVQHARHVRDKVSKMFSNTYNKTSSFNRGNMTEYTPKNVRLFGDNRMTKAEAGRRLNKERTSHQDIKNNRDSHQINREDKIRSIKSEVLDKIGNERPHE